MAYQHSHCSQNIGYFVGLLLQIRDILLVPSSLICQTAAARSTYRIDPERGNALAKGRHLVRAGTAQNPGLW